MVKHRSSLSGTWFKCRKIWKSNERKDDELESQPTFLHAATGVMPGMSSVHMSNHVSNEEDLVVEEVDYDSVSENTKEETQHKLGSVKVSVDSTPEVRPGVSSATVNEIDFDTNGEDARQAVCCVNSNNTVY